MAKKTYLELDNIVDELSEELSTDDLAKLMSVINVRIASERNNVEFTNLVRRLKKIKLTQYLWHDTISLTNREKYMHFINGKMVALWYHDPNDLDSMYTVSASGVLYQWTNPWTTQTKTWKRLGSVPAPFRRRFGG